MSDLMFYIILSTAGVITSITVLLGVVFVIEAQWERRK